MKKARSISSSISANAELEAQGRVRYGPLPRRQSRQMAATRLELRKVRSLAPDQLLHSALAQVPKELYRSPNVDTARSALVVGRTVVRRLIEPRKAMSYRT